MRSGEGREEGGGRDTERGGDRNAYNKDAYSFRREEREREREKGREEGRSRSAVKTENVYCTKQDRPYRFKKNPTTDCIVGE